MKQMTVLSHNAFWFQGVPFLTDRPPGPDVEVLKRLCTIYQQADPNVICLQEIQSSEAFEMVREHLGMPGCYCPGTTLSQYGGAVFWGSGCGRQLHDSHASEIATQRMWQVVEVSGSDCGLRICNIHLPSNRQLGAQAASTQRITELQDAIQSCATGLDIIVGDFNEEPGGRTGECLSSHDYCDAAELSDRTDRRTNIGDGRGDYIWIKGVMRDRLLMYDVIGKRELSCRDIGKEYLSDHLPLCIRLEN